MKRSISGVLRREEDIAEGAVEVVEVEVEAEVAKEAPRAEGDLLEKPPSCEVPRIIARGFAFFCNL